MKKYVLLVLLWAVLGFGLGFAPGYKYGEKNGYDNGRSDGFSDAYSFIQKADLITTDTPVFNGDCNNLDIVVVLKPRLTGMQIGCESGLDNNEYIISNVSLEMFE